MNVENALFVDTEELQSQLQEMKYAPIKLIVSDGVFSMDGSIAPLMYGKQTCIYHFPPV